MKDLILTTLIVALIGCSNSHQELTKIPSLRIDNNILSVKESSPFLTRLEVNEVKSGEEKFSLKTVGQIIALANSSGLLTGTSVSWTELDPDFTKSLSLKLPLSPLSIVGTAFGVTTISSEYSSQIKIGHRVFVARYGISGSKFPAQIVSILRSKEVDGNIQVVFKMTGASDWYPGLNCELTFPMFQVTSVKIPQIAIVHEGHREFVFKEVGPRKFILISVTVASEDEKDAQVLGLTSKDKIVTEGAILLKPQIHLLLKDEGILTHAP